jgi:hypothetical protein
MELLNLFENLHLIACRKLILPLYLFIFLYRLEQFLDETKVPTHHPGNSYQGNSCRKILSHFRQETQKRIIYVGYGANLFEIASQIERYAVARTLSDEEIDELESYINLFFNVLKEYGERVYKFLLNKNKIHMLKEHVLPFVRLFKSWGLFSEESVESIHHVRNDLDDRIPGAGPEVDEKRNDFFKKTQAVAFHYSMPRISNSRKKQKEAALRIKEAKRFERINATPESGTQNVDESSNDIKRSKLKAVGKKVKGQKNVIVTRHQAVVMEIEAKEKEESRKQTYKATEKLAETRKRAKEMGIKRRQIIDELNKNILKKRKKGTIFCHIYTHLMF